MPGGDADNGDDESGQNEGQDDSQPDNGGQSEEPSDGTPDNGNEEPEGDNGNGEGNENAGGESQEEPEDKVECESSWDDEAYKAEECTGHWYCFATEFTSQLKAAANVVWDFVTGVMAGLKDQVTDLWELLTDPGVLLDLAKQFVDDPKGTLMGIVEGIGEDVQKVLECGPKDIGRIIGQNINPMTPVKVISKLAKLSGNADLAKYAKKLEKDITCASFPENTTIWSQSGNFKIQDVVEGMAVSSRNQNDLVNQTQNVVGVITRHAKGYHQLKTEKGVISATPEHPFWVQGKGWVPIKDIEWEDPIVTIDGDVVVYDNDYVNEEIRVYNFTVDETSTYFAGEIGAWVHNTSCQIQYSKSTGKTKELNKPDPNTVYYVDGRHRYVTDEHGRTTNVQTTISEQDLDSGIRNCYQQGKAGACGLPDDEGGHLVATRVGGARREN